MAHLATGLAAADAGEEGAARGLAPGPPAGSPGEGEGLAPAPPAGNPGEGLAPGAGAAGLGPCTDNISICTCTLCHKVDIIGIPHEKCTH